METKQVIVIRKDLNMRKGKMIAQGAHASMKVLIDSAVKSADGRAYFISTHPANPWYHWLTGLFTKIVVGCDSEEELIDLKLKADSNDLPTAIIQDVGRTEFNNVPTYTALAIGPGTVNEVDKITGHLKLL